MKIMRSLDLVETENIIFDKIFFVENIINLLNKILLIVV